MQVLLSRSARIARRFRANHSGATAVTVALLLPVMLGIGALVIDMGRAFIAQRELQAFTDASALAGAQDIYDGTAVAAANTYSATPGNLNTSRFGEVNMVAGYPSVRCLTGLQAAGIPCLGPSVANVITVRQTTSVDLFFGPLVGIDSLNIGATATASARGGASRPLNVVIVVDTTASMGGTDRNCGLGNSSTRLDCAKQGMLALLNQFDPQYDRVGLLTYPGLTNSTGVSRQIDCTSNVASSNIAPYDANPIYTLVQMTTNYRTGATGPLNVDSNLIKAASSNLTTATGDRANCTGMEARGGVGTYYANVVTAAQAELDARGDSRAQDAIIILTDGDASADSDDVPSGQSNYQCQRAVLNSQPPKANGTWIFTIGYGASNSSGCSTDGNAMPGLSPAITSPRRPCKILRAMATDDEKFYSTTACPGSQNITNLVTIFQRVGTALQSARLVPNNAT